MTLVGVAVHDHHRHELLVGDLVTSFLPDVRIRKYASIQDKVTIMRRRLYILMFPPTLVKCSLLLSLFALFNLFYIRLFPFPFALHSCSPLRSLQVVDQSCVSPSLILVCIDSIQRRQKANLRKNGCVSAFKPQWVKKRQPNLTLETDMQQVYALLKNYTVG